MKERVVLVTGASSGIGRATALKFAGEGSQLALVARSANKVAALAAEIESNGSTARPITADLTQEGDIEVSSVAGLRAFPGILAYCVSKAAVDQLTRCLALEVADKGVRVNAVNPGVVVTNLHREAGMAEESYAAFLERSHTTHPLGRVGRPEEVADLIYFLASPQAGWMTGTTVSIDGGRAQTCAR